MNAKASLQERQRRHRESDGDEAAERETKRLRLEEIENQAMNEENPDKLTKLFEDYRSENMRSADVFNRAKVVMWQAHRVCLLWQWRRMRWL